MKHLNGDNIEPALAISRPFSGITKCTPFYAREAWYYYDGGEGSVVNAALPTTNAFGFGRPNLSAYGQALVWNGTAGNSEDANGATAEWEHQLSAQFAGDGGEKMPQLVAKIRAGKSGAGTDNADLALSCEAFVAVPGGSAESLGAEDITLSAKATLGNLTDLDEYTFDIGKLARLVGLAHRLVPGARVYLRVSPNEDVGANINLSIDGGEWHENLHESTHDVSKRLGARG